MHASRWLSANCKHAWYRNALPAGIGVPDLDEWIALREREASCQGLRRCADASAYAITKPGMSHAHACPETSRFVSPDESFDILTHIILGCSDLFLFAGIVHFSLELRHADCKSSLGQFLFLFPRSAVDQLYYELTEVACINNQRVAIIISKLISILRIYIYLK